MVNFEELKLTSLCEIQVTIPLLNEVESPMDQTAALNSVSMPDT